MPSARELLEEVDALMQRNRGAAGGTIAKPRAKDADALNKAIDAAEQVEIDRLDAAQASRRKTDHADDPVQSGGSDDDAIDKVGIDDDAIEKDEHVQVANADRPHAGASAKTADDLRQPERAKPDSAKANGAKADRAKAHSAKADNAKADSAKADSANAKSANADDANADSAKAPDDADEGIPLLTDLAITDGAGRVQSSSAAHYSASRGHASAQLDDFPVLTDVVEEIDEIDVVSNVLAPQSSMTPAERKLDPSHAAERPRDESAKTVPVWDASHPSSESLDELAAMAAAASEPMNAPPAVHDVLPMEKEIGKDQDYALAIDNGRDNEAPTFAVAKGDQPPLPSTAQGAETPVLDGVADASDLRREAASTTIEKPLNGDESRWSALAEEIRIQVLQRLDIFMDEGLQSQLRERVQPVVDRASAELVNTINREVGRLLRAYVAEAIEREIEQWRGQNR